MRDRAHAWRGTKLARDQARPRIQNMSRVRGRSHVGVLSFYFEAQGSEKHMFMQEIICFLKSRAQENQYFCKKTHVFEAKGSEKPILMQEN